LVEDDARTRQRFITSIAQVPQWRLAFAADGLAAARRALVQDVPDALLVDLGLPDGSGLELIEAVVRQSPQCHILVISVFGDDDKVFQCIEAGASGYIIKGQGDDELAAHLEELFTGGSPVSPRIARRLWQAVRQQRMGTDTPVATPSKPAELTAQEHHILSLLALGYTYNEVAEQSHISVNTVRFHIKGIYSKLYVSSRAEAVYAASRRGWITSLGIGVGR
jgi:DNA-binding NarL/FixJ family response regulator